LREVFQDNYGDDPLRPASENDGDPKDITDDQLRCTNVRALKRFTNAYMLVYFQSSKLDDILSDVDESDIPTHLSKSSKSLKEDVLNTLLPQQKNSPKQQRDIRLKKNEKSSSDRKCNIM
jgi:hypothetical protein